MALLLCDPLWRHRSIDIPATETGLKHTEWIVTSAWRPVQCSNNASDSWRELGELNLGGLGPERGNNGMGTGSAELIIRNPLNTRITSIPKREKFGEPVCQNAPTLGTCRLLHIFPATPSVFPYLWVQIPKLRSTQNTRGHRRLLCFPWRYFSEFTQSADRNSLPRFLFFRGLEFQSLFHMRCTYVRARGESKYAQLLASEHFFRPTTLGAGNHHTGSGHGRWRHLPRLEENAEVDDTRHPGHSQSHSWFLCTYVS